MSEIASLLAEKPNKANFTSTCHFLFLLLSPPSTPLILEQRERETRENLLSYRDTLRCCTRTRERNETRRMFTSNIFPFR